MVNTVCGAIESRELGFTLMHEHMAMVDPAMRLAFPDWFDRERFIELSVPQLKRARSEGVEAILDPTPISLGRNVELIRTLSEKSGVRMMACTGLYYFDTPNVTLPDPRWLSRLFVRELTEGCEGTSIRAAAIKCATEDEVLSDTNRCVLEASAIASNETGAPILAHSNALNQNGLAQVELFRRMGVDFDRLVICHVDEAAGPEYALRLLDSGAVIGFDRFGLIGRTTTERRVRILEQLLGQGYASRIVLGHDSHLYEDFWRPWHTEKYLPQDDTNNFHVISTRIIPRLLADGIPQRDIDAMTQTNPARLLDWR